MGIGLMNPPPPPSHHRTHKVFLLFNYLILGFSSACIFLTLSLRLLPSPCGLLLILLHSLTAAGAAAGCAAPSAASTRLHAAHMAATVLAAILQGASALLVFTRTDDFLGKLHSYVREDDGAVILKMVGGLGIAVFCFEWVVLALAFALRYYAYLEGDCGGNPRSGKTQGEDLKDWPWPFQV